MFQTMANRFLLILVLCACSTFVSSIYIHYSNKNVNLNNSFRVDFDRLEVNLSGVSSRPPLNLSRLIPIYKNLSKISVDERCLTGKPLGAAIFQYSPYANTNHFYDKKTKKSGFNIYGIFPAIMKKAVSVCCHPNSGIRFAKLLISQEFGNYDFYFPFYGDDMDSTSYRGNPFIQAPSVALMVPDDDSKEPKTGLIVMTIFRAWPMLIFILLMASCAGIIMWFLVSCRLLCRPGFLTLVKKKITSADPSDLFIIGK